MIKKMSSIETECHDEISKVRTEQMAGMAQVKEMIRGIEERQPSLKTEEVKKIAQNEVQTLKVSQERAIGELRDYTTEALELSQTQVIQKVEERLNNMRN